MAGLIWYQKRKHWKYKLSRDYFFNTTIPPKNREDFKGEFLSLSANGKLNISAGYCWDGPSGPTIDTSNFMRGSLVHDALYQLIREGVVDPEFRGEADEILRRICLQDGMSRIRSWWVFKSVRAFGKVAIEPDIIKAPG